MFDLAPDGEQAWVPEMNTDGSLGDSDHHIIKLNNRVVGTAPQKLKVVTFNFQKENFSKMGKSIRNEKGRGQR